MAKDPAFLFYTQDFQTGTQFFTDEQVGKYIRLLCAQHQHGHLSEKHMLSICRAYDEDILSKFKKDKEGKYYNERLENEALKRAAYAESRRNNAKHPKKQKSHGEHMLQHMENENDNIEIKEFKKFEEWIEKNAPNVGKMQQPFTVEQYKEAKTKFDKEVVKEILKAMHNHRPLLKNNVSAYLTLSNWIARREESGKGAKVIPAKDANPLSTLKRLGA